MSIDFLYAAAALGLLALVLPLTIHTAKWSLDERRRRKHASRRGGNITEAIRRDIRFWDDEPDPWEWVG